MDEHDSSTPNQDCCHQACSTRGPGYGPGCEASQAQTGWISHCAMDAMDTVFSAFGLLICPLWSGLRAICLLITFSNHLKYLTNQGFIGYESHYVPVLNFWDNTVTRAYML